MKKKIVGMLSCLVLIMLSVFGLTACDCKHESSSWKTITTATCANQGVEQKTCSDCGGVLETKTIEKTAHTPSEWIDDVVATCEAGGMQHKECTVCGEILQTQTVALTTHTPSGWITDKQATCEENGLQHKECTVCETLLESEKTPKLAHTPSGWITDKQATCEENGLQHKECTECEALLESERTPKLAHTPSEWIIDNEATYDSKGLRHKECTECETILEYGLIDETGVVSLQGQKLAKNRNESAVIDLSKDELIMENDISISSANTVVTAVSGQEITVEFSAINNVITIESTSFNAGNYSVKIVIAKGEREFAYEIKLEIIDYAIGTVGELDEFLADVKSAVRGNKSWVVELTDDIDYNNASTFVTRNYTNQDLGYFTGSFDGNGYTISNVTLSGNAMFWGVENAIIKNVAFVNVNRSGNVTGSVLVWNSYGANTIENVYLKATYDNTNVGTASALICEGKDFTLNNVIVDVEFSTADKTTAINYHEGCFAGDNVYVISSTAKSFCTCETHQGAVGMYASADALKSAISANSLASFSSDYWDITSGVPVWKNLGA